ncbi:hypothetical protein N0M98_33425 [Paenibacillus doosanensis]|uniref:Uncharacterized protein n=1 Tax=Paenibacillus konkukensis TaxID=2020716 RepID=A0ABY4RKS3_9BACL|nr:MULTISPECIES: hypothetical protein [Paenibacillus]MCS7464986.1 hypothetical protein [Paenibacillus doosanensis]UQZ83016.1 hypothetical protein SK3146_02176 [Paenibacillus konkukensis]
MTFQAEKGDKHMIRTILTDPFAYGYLTIIEVDAPQAQPQKNKIEPQTAEIEFLCRE